MGSLFRGRGLGWQHLSYPDFDIDEGELTVISGPSGCGKSTLLKLFNGVYSADRGQLFCRERLIEELDIIALRREALLAGQTVYLFPGSIADNFAEYYSYRELPRPETQTMRDYLDICCLDFPLEADCSQMSGGERQRVYLSVFLSLASSVIMLDEPTSALDQDTGWRLLSQVKEHCRRRGMSALVVSHDMRCAERLADREIKL
ncbi:ATP-binding cassette domain-containing protein [bacterium]|nr:ATP-binding cassette domain-containing protein [bacterium]